MGKAQLAQSMEKQIKDTKAPDTKSPTLDELKVQAKAALVANDDSKFNEILGKIAVVQAAEAKAKLEAERAKAKAEAEKIRAEVEALAKVREEAEFAIFKAIKALKLDKQLADLKVFGFTYKINRVDNTTEPPTTITETKVQLITPQIKLPKVSKGGTSGAGKSKAEFGMSLGEIFDKFANDDEKLKLSQATSNSSQWQVKVAVKKRAIEAGLIKPIA